jgi:hypothetical protein
LPADGRHQEFERALIGGARRQIDPGVELEETQGGIGAGEQHRDHRKAGLASLTVEREVPLPLLPRAKALGTDKDGDRAAGCQRILQRQRPRLPGGEIPAVQKHTEAALMETARDLPHRRMINGVIAEEDVERARQSSPVALLFSYSG